MLKSTAVKNFSKLLLLAARLVLTLMAAKGAFGATTNSRKNSLGTVSYQDNPYIYLAADKVLDAADVEGNLNLRLHPMWTYMLFDQQVLFCGMPLDKMEGVAVPFVITYERRSHRMVQGVGCHNIQKIDSVQTTREVK
jgi:hypothetical protein